MFRLATLILLVLTLSIIAGNVAGWVLIRRMYERLRSRASVPASPNTGQPEGFWDLSSVIRIEAAYFLLLLLYWVVFPGVLAALPVMFVVIYHFLGFAGNEWTGVVRRAEKEAISRRRALDKVIAAVAVLDGLEMIVLGYVTWKLSASLMAF